MTIEFISAYTKTPVVEFNWPVDAIQPLFDDYQTWNSDKDLKGGDYPGLDKRLSKNPHQIKENSQPLSDFIDTISSSKQKLVEKFLEIDTEYRWPTIPKEIADQLTVYGQLISNLPGYKMGSHLDNRTVYAAGYLNVFDNESVTSISTKKASFFNRSQYKAPGKQGQGVIWLNTENSWHRVRTVSKDRKIIFFTYQIMLWNL